MHANDDAIRLLGIDVTDVSASSATASMVVRPDMTNGHDVCHGGFIFTLADTAMAYASNGGDTQAFATAADIDFINPALAHRTLSAVATERSLRGRAGIYDVTVTDETGTLIAEFRGRTIRTDKPVITEPTVESP